MKRYSIDFSDDDYGIEILAENEEKAREIVANPLSWKDRRPRTISYIREEEE